MLWWWGQKAGRSHFHPHTGSRGSEQEVQQGSKLSKSSSSDLLPPTRLHLLRAPQSPKQHHHLGNEGSMHPPMEATSHSHYHESYMKVFYLQNKKNWSQYHLVKLIPYDIKKVDVNLWLRLTTILTQMFIH